MYIRSVKVLHPLSNNTAEALIIIRTGLCDTCAIPYAKVLLIYRIFRMFESIVITSAHTRTLILVV